MDDLIREINGIKEQLGWSDECGVEAPTVTRHVMQLCDLVVALARRLNTISDHNHLLHQWDSSRTGDVIKRGY